MIQETQFEPRIMQMDAVYGELSGERSYLR